MPTYSSEWDKGDYRANNEQRGRMGFGGTEHGAAAAAERSRAMGVGAQERGAYQSNFGQSNQARGVTGQGVDLALSAARGQQPSAAEILARRNTAAGVRAGQSMAAGIKGGPGARVAAMRNAQRMGAQTIAEGGARAEQLRAQEMADARGQVIQGGAVMRSGDLDAQRIQQQNELTQRGMNDAQQRFFEQQGFNTQVQDQNNQLQQQGLASGMWSAGRGSEQADEQFGFGKLMKYTEAAAGAAGGAAAGAAGAMTSDEQAKQLIPMGSLAPLMGGGRGAASANVTAGAPASFDKLTPSGGMDVTGSLKAHSNFATKFQRDPSGGMMSDWRSKDIMYSPGEIKNPEDYVSQVRKSGGYANPDMTPIPAGPSRPAPAYEPASWLSQEMDARGDQDAIAGADPYPQRPDPNADAIADYGRHFNVDAARDDARKADNLKEGQKIRESIAKDPKGGSPVMGSLAGFLGGLSGGARMRSDVKSKDGVMYSDDKTKLAAAFEAGKAAAVKPTAPTGKPEIGGKVKDAIKSATGKDAQKLHDVAQNAAVGSTPVTAPLAALGPAQDAAANAIHDAQRGKPDPTARRDVEDAAIDVGYAAAAGPVFGNIATRIARSDERAKNVIDLDEPEIDLDKPEPGSSASSMRDGSSDPRTNSFDKTFRRDTKADQKRVKKGVEDKAGKDADAMMASMRASMGQGPTARSEDLQDDAPDLREAAKAGGDAGRIPEHAMFKAMKAMEPSLYSYKPEFRPPEQAPGEVQAGPMANNMERDPIAGTAITRDPGTGLLAIDKDKALKLTMGSLAVLADDVESLKRKKKGAR
jgi:hypothetical protein